MAEKKTRTPISPYGMWAYQRLMEEQMTVTELGKRIGVQRQHLSSYFHGRLRDYNYRVRIERVLGEPPPEIKDSLDELAG